jgi:hypothetical protein
MLSHRNSHLRALPEKQKQADIIHLMKFLSGSNDCRAMWDFPPKGHLLVRFPPKGHLLANRTSLLGNGILPNTIPATTLSAVL